MKTKLICLTSVYMCVFFFLDRVFHSNETTKNVYEEIAVPIIDSAIQGYNGLYAL